MFVCVQKVSVCLVYGALIAMHSVSEPNKWPIEIDKKKKSCEIIFCFHFCSLFHKITKKTKKKKLLLMHEHYSIDS